MPSRTKAGLNLADKNSYVRVEENINDNLLKIDDDVDATWGGLYGGDIQDETIPKVVGKRYRDRFNGKAYLCIKPSNVNTEDAYTECNVVSNLNKLHGLFTKELIYSKGQPYATKKYYGQFDFLIISVSLDGSSETEYNHSGIMPVLKDNYHQRFYLGQWGLPAANYIQVSFLSDGTTNFTVEDNSATLNRIYGVKINN